MTIFEKNIKALIKKNPHIATNLYALNSHPNFEVVQQGDDPVNINIIDKKNSYPMYESDFLSYLKEKQEEFKKYAKYPFLYMFGIGNGVFVKLLLQNHTIILYEPNLEILFIALSLVDFSKEIEEEKLKIYYPPNYSFPQAYHLFQDPQIKVYSKLYELLIHSTYYEKFYSDEIIKVNQLNTRAIKQVIIGLGNDVKDTLLGLEHTIKNFPIQIKNIPYKKFVKKNKNIADYAIIVSTGPSLTKQLPLLKEIAPYAAIISVDASMPILEKEGIKPDYVTSLERIEATARFFKETSPEFQKDIVMIHASLQHEEVLKNSHGIKTLPFRPFRYTYYFGLHNYGYVGIGMSAANMAYEFAVMSGYKNIILIGQDLAYGEDGTSHADGHSFGKYEVKFRDDDLYVPKYGGDGVIRTSKTWMMFKNHFEKEINDAKEGGVITYNATEGGARIEGAIEKPFKELVDKIKSINKKKRKIKLVYPTKKEIDKNLLKAYKKAKEMEEYGAKLQKRLENLFLEVAKECEKIEELNKKNQLEKINYKKLLKLSNKIDKIKDRLETKKFYMMYGEAVQSELIHQEMELAKVHVKLTNTNEEKKAKLVDWIMKHRYWLFSIAGVINAQRIVINRNLKYLEEELKKRGLLEDKK